MMLNPMMNMRHRTIPVATIINRVKRPVGRTEIYDGGQQSKFVQMFLYNAPCQPLMLLEHCNDWVVLGNNEMFWALHNFKNGRFALSNLVYFQELEGLKYSEMDRTWQRRFDELDVWATTIRENSPQEELDKMWQMMNFTHNYMM